MPTRNKKPHRSISHSANIESITEPPTTGKIRIRDPSKFMILSILYISDEPMSVGSILEASIGRLSRASCYSLIKSLLEMGLISKLRPAKTITPEEILKIADKYRESAEGDCAESMMGDTEDPIRKYELSASGRGFMQHIIPIAAIRAILTGHAKELNFSDGLRFTSAAKWMLENPKWIKEINTEEKEYVRSNYKNPVCAHSECQSEKGELVMA